MKPPLSNDDRIATIAACSSTAHSGYGTFGSEPLGPIEWSEVGQWLQWQGMRPAALLDPAMSPAIRAGLKPRLAERVVELPSRADQVSGALDALERRGFWALVRFDDAYPQRWRDRLKTSAPPVIFGCGERELLIQTPSAAIVGSRNIDHQLAGIAREIGSRSASAGYLVVSGGARGSDRWGMTGALELERQALGILHGDLAKDSQRPDARSHIENGLLTLVAHVHPSTGFVTGNAMARNRYIHALADATFVVATAEGTGGTWQGSVDNLDRSWSPLLVWMGEGAPPGNTALVERGGYPIDAIPHDTADLEELIAAARQHQQDAGIARPVQSTLNL